MHAQGAVTQTNVFICWLYRDGNWDLGVQKFKNEYMKYKEKLLKYGNTVNGKDELKVEGEGKLKWKKLDLLG